MLNSSFLKKKARELRKNGKTHREISRELSISLGSAFTWTKDIVLDSALQEQIRKKHRDTFLLSREKAAFKKHEIVFEKEKKIEELAKSEFPLLIKDRGFLLGLVLYWSEGFKKDHSLGFVNSDPHMVRQFVEWLQLFGGVKKDEIRGSIRIHTAYADEVLRIQTEWANFIGLSQAQFQKPFFQTSLSFPEKKETGYIGMLRIRVPGKRELFVKILTWLQEFRKMSLFDFQE